MTCLLNLEVMHSLKGYVPVTYSTRLTFIHTHTQKKTVLATIIPAKKNPTVSLSKSLQCCRWTQPSPPLPAQVKSCHITPSSSSSLVGVLISKHLFVHPIRDLVQENISVPGNMQIGIQRPVCY